MNGCISKHAYKQAHTWIIKCRRTCPTHTNRTHPHTQTHTHTHTHPPYHIHTHSNEHTHIRHIPSTQPNTSTSVPSHTHTYAPPPPPPPPPPPTLDTHIYTRVHDSKPLSFSQHDHHHWKAERKRCVFNADLKEEGLGDDLILSGIDFQTEGAE